MAKKFVVSARLEAEDRASGTIKKVEGRFGKFASFLAKSFVVTLGDITRLSRDVVQAFSGWVEASLDAEDAQRALETALKKTGDASQDVIDRLGAQGAAIQKTTEFTSDQVTQTQAFLKQLGVQTSQLGLATQATVDLAKSFDLDLTSAARNVGKTVGGFAGELGELIPELKDLDREALQAGQGIELLARKFNGAADAAGDTLRGQLTGLKNDLADLGKAFATGVTGTGDFKDSVKELREEVEDLEDDFDSAGRGIRLMTEAAAKAPPVVKSLAASIASMVTGPLKLVKALGAWEKAQEDLTKATEQGLAVNRAWIIAMNERKKATDGAVLSQARLAELAERDARVNKEAAARLMTVTEGLQAFGFTLEQEVSDKIAQNNKLLEESRILYDQRILQNGKLVISSSDLARLEGQVAAENAKLTGSLREQNEALDENADKTKDAGEGIKGLGEKAKAAREEMERLEQGIRKVSEASGTLGSQNFGGTQSGGSLLFPDSAIANTARRGGKNVRVLPDGTRVVA